MYSDSTFSTSKDDKASDYNVHIDMTSDGGKMFIQLKNKDYSHSLNLFLSKDVADDLAWRIQSCLRSIDEQVVDV
jgi:hypothetical protein